METIVVLAAGLVIGLLAVFLARAGRRRLSVDGYGARRPDAGGAVTAALAEIQAQAAADRSSTREALNQVLDAQQRLAAEHRAQAEAELEERRRALREEADARLAALDDRLEHGRRVVEDVFGRREEAINSEVTEMRRQLRDFSGLVQKLEQHRQHQQGVLDETLQSLGSTTKSLSQALANPKRRGQWGERTAEDLLGHMGLIEGVHYRRQTANAAGSIPDITFLLPDDRVLNMDVKFPIDAYLRYLEADNDTDRLRHERDFLRAVRARVRELRGRDYIDPEAGTVDQVLCFVPNEAVYAFICERGHAVVDEALAERVVLCSPTNLYSLLAVIRQATSILQVERTSDQALTHLGAFEKQWSKFCDQLDKVERQLGTVNKSFEHLVTTRRRELERPLDRLDALRDQRAEPEAEADLPALRAVGDDQW